MSDPRVERTRTVVLAAVLGLLGEEGPAAVTHTRVAEAAGVGRATVYRHWPDRVGLLVDAIASYRPDVELPTPTGDVREDLVDLLVVMAGELQHRTEMPEMVAMLARSEGDPDLVELRRRLAELNEEPLVPHVARLREQGVDLDQDVLVATLFGPLFALRFMLGRELTPELVEQHVDRWLRSLGVDA